jgi:hypothetical protein
LQMVSLLTYQKTALQSMHPPTTTLFSMGAT